MHNLADAGSRGFKISVVMTRHNVAQLDEFKAIVDRFDAQLRITRLRPSGRGADVWDELHVTADQQRELYEWLAARGATIGRNRRRLRCGAGIPARPTHHHRRTPVASTPRRLRANQARTN